MCEERCLSIPDTPRPVLRSTPVRFRHLDGAGVGQKPEFERPGAMVMQRESYHLGCVLILDRTVRQLL